MKKIIETIKNIWRIEDLRTRILMTLLFVAFYRLGSFVVLPGIDPEALQQLQNQTNEDAFIFWNDDPIIQKELHKYGIHGQFYPFAEQKNDNTAAYVEDKQVHFTQPIAFNMEQEELALTGTHNLFNSMAAGISANLAGIRKDCIREALSDFEV